MLVSHTTTSNNNNKSGGLKIIIVLVFSLNYNAWFHLFIGRLTIVVNLMNDLPEQERNNAFSISSIYSCLVRTSTCKCTTNNAVKCYFRCTSIC